MILNVITDPNPILHRVSRDVTVEELNKKELKSFIKDLTETMYEKDGVGIAAPQVANSIQLCVIAKDYSPFKKDLILVNPRWQKNSLKTGWDTEGCLSVPRKYGEVKRYKDINVTALDENGKELKFIAKDFFARIIQHEVDHLNGILFIEKAKNIHEVDKQVSI